MNAVSHFVALLPPEALRRLAALRVPRFEPHVALGPAGAPDLDEAGARIRARWDGDLCGLLNALTRGELAVIARRLGGDPAGRAPGLRAALWERGASFETGGLEVAAAVQPRPAVTS